MSLPTEEFWLKPKSDEWLTRQSSKYKPSKGYEMDITLKPIELC